MDGISPSSLRIRFSTRILMEKGSLEISAIPDSSSILILKKVYVSPLIVTCRSNCFLSISSLYLLKKKLS